MERESAVTRRDEMSAEHWTAESASMLPSRLCLDTADYAISRNTGQQLDELSLGDQEVAGLADRRICIYLNIQHQRCFAIRDIEIAAGQLQENGSLARRYTVIGAVVADDIHTELAVDFHARILPETSPKVKHENLDYFCSSAPLLAETI